MNRKLLILGALFGLTAVMLGAFGAHGLEKMGDALSLSSFETGVRYQFYHAFLLIITSFLPLSPKRKSTVYYLLLAGVILFSGSIYLLSTQRLTGIDFSGIALLTPLGGLLLIAAWAFLLYWFAKDKSAMGQ